MNAQKNLPLGNYKTNGGISSFARGHILLPLVLRARCGMNPVNLNRTNLANMSKGVERKAAGLRLML